MLYYYRIHLLFLESNLDKSVRTRSLGREASTFLSPATSPSSLRFSPSIINKDTSSLEAATLLWPRVQQSTIPRLKPFRLWCWPWAEPLHTAESDLVWTEAQWWGQQDHAEFWRCKWRSVCVRVGVLGGGVVITKSKMVHAHLKKILHGRNVHILIKYSRGTSPVRKQPFFFTFSSTGFVNKTSQ